MSDDEITTPQITPELLIDLHNMGISRANTAAQARGEFGSRMRGLQESHGLDLKAFRMASAIRKMPNGKREHMYRALLAYCDMLDVNQQKDIEDHINEQHQGADLRTDIEAALDGQPREAARIIDPDRPDAGQVGSAHTPDSPLGKAALARFKKNLADAATVEAVNTGLERFSADNPKLADDALLIAKARLGEIEADASGGEDLRPTALREGAAREAEQAADAGKRTARQRKKRGEGEADQPAAG